MPDDLTRRRHLLATALVGALLPAEVPDGRVMRAWLDSWSGIGHVTVGMARQDYDLKLTRYGNRGWRDTFFLASPEHSLHPRLRVRVRVRAVARCSGRRWAPARFSPGTFPQAFRRSRHRH